MRFLFTNYEGGGHVPPAILMARLLKDRGHDVLFVSDEANRRQAEAADLEFKAWRTAPNRFKGGQPDDPLDDWRHSWPPAAIRAVARAVMTGPADRYAADTTELVRAFRPHLVVSNELLLGALAACEALGQPCAILSGNLWCFPNRLDLPPFGPGWPPARTAFERRREASARTLIGRWYDAAGLEPLNVARRGLGLVPVARLTAQLSRATPIVIASSALFDYEARPPEPFVYAGPLIDRAEVPTPSDLLDPHRRNVLLSFSTTYQNQSRLYARCIRALAPLEINLIVTTGPAARPQDLPQRANVKTVEWTPHDGIVPFCDLVVCHGGHGTLMRPLLAGVPVLCLPMGRDHPDNGRRLVEHGAGLTASRRSPGLLLRASARRLLEEPLFRQGAAVLGRKMSEAAVQERRRAIRALEGAAQRSRIDCVARPSPTVKEAERHPGGPNAPRALRENP